MDARTQGLLRRFQQTGSLEDEQRLLKARLRSGALSSRQLQLAAFLGHAAALELVGTQVPKGSPSVRADPLGYLRNWGEIVAGLGWRLSARALLGVALEHQRPDRDLFPDREALRLAVAKSDRIQQLLVCPDGRLPAECADWPAAGGGMGYYHALELAHRSLRQQSSAPFTSWFGTWAPLRDGSATPHVVASLEAFVLGRRRPADCPTPELWAISAEVAPVLLGHPDPILVRSARSLETLRTVSPCPRRPGTLTLAGEETLLSEGRVTRCAECDIAVFDVQGMAPDDARALIEGTTGRLCVGLYQRVAGAVQERDCPRAQAVAAARYTDPPFMDTGDGIWQAPEPAHDAHPDLGLSESGDPPFSGDDSSSWGLLELRDENTSATETSPDPTDEAPPWTPSSGVLDLWPGEDDD